MFTPLAATDLFWQSSIEELVQGYVFDEKQEAYVCLVCTDHFTDGVIHQMDGDLLEAKRAIKVHMKKQHGSMFNYLTQLNKKYTGLTDHQTEIIQYFYQGLTDKEIAQKTGANSTSTIRNYRFKLREKEKQAKAFLAIMESLKNKQEQKDEFTEIHRGATMIDERYSITKKEEEKILKTYLDDEGRLKQFPSKEKRKIVILQHLVKRFEHNKNYTEKEVNEKIKAVYADFATLRRYLIEYGFLDRSKDCTKYWVNQ